MSGGATGVRHEHANRVRRDAWSLQIELDAASGLLRDVDTGATLPLITDAWTTLTVSIDLDSNLQTIAYEGAQLEVRPWLAHVEFGAAVTALSLTGLGSSPVYFDDLSLECQGVSTCSGDTNGDGVINIDDLVNVFLDWGTSGSANGGDLTGALPGSPPDGLVDVMRKRVSAPGPEGRTWIAGMEASRRGPSIGSKSPHPLRWTPWCSTSGSSAASMPPAS